MGNSQSRTHFLSVNIPRCDKGRDCTCSKKPAFEYLYEFSFVLNDQGLIGIGFIGSKCRNLDLRNWSIFDEDIDGLLSGSMYNQSLKNPHLNIFMSFHLFQTIRGSLELDSLALNAQT